MLSSKFESGQVAGFQEVPQLGFGIRLMLVKLAAAFGRRPVAAHQPDSTGRVSSPSLSHRGGRGIALGLLLLMLTPVGVFAQASAAPAGAPRASVVGGTTGAPAASAGGAQAKPEASAPQAASASASPSEPGVRALPTPVGGNATKETAEPLSYFAYLLIILGGIWFFAAIAGIVRLMSRPPSPAVAAAIPDAERDRPFLSFIMPFGALITVAIIVTIWGILFLATSHLSELYPLAIDLFVVCLVMLIATIAALRSGGQPRTEVH